MIIQMNLVWWFALLGTIFLFLAGVLNGYNGGSLNYTLLAVLYAIANIIIFLI